MAISKEILNNKKKKTNQPEPLGTVPANNPDHVSAPTYFHHPIPPKPVLHNSFAEAVSACEQIFLKPGEAHTEFYQENGIIHCVVGIGNYNPGYKHLYLTDTGGNMSIDERLNDMAKQINILNNTVEVYAEDVSGLKKDVSILNENIVKFENNINHALEDIRHDIETFEGSISEQLENTSTQIAELSEQVENISNYVNRFNERIQQNADNIVDLSTRVGEIENWKPEADASINRLEDLINEFEPIDTSSIRSLFYDDIYTVNLCCYTAAGHVEIFDDIAGEKWGGDSSRVAECTPFNEYKTYIEGDDVSFMAVANEGYKFVNWFYGDGYNIINYADTSIIELEFGKSDIPVIGTLGIDANPDEPAILSFGYTAFFRKLHTLKWDLHTSSNTDWHSVEYNNDAIKVIITDIDSAPKEYIVDNNYTGKIYFDDGAKVEIISMSSEEGHHTFEGFTLNDSIERLQSPLIINNAKDDIKVDAYFKEWWIFVEAAAVPLDKAEVRGGNLWALDNTEISIKIFDIAEGYNFTNWIDSSLGDELSQYVSPSITSTDILLSISKEVSRYHLEGLIEISKPKYVRVTTPDNISDSSEYILVSNASTTINNKKVDLTINASYNTDNYFNFYGSSTGIIDVATIDSFQIPDGYEEPDVFLKLEKVDSVENGYYINLNDEYITAAKSGNKFANRVTKGNPLSPANIWKIDNNMTIYNDSFDPQRVIKFNNDSPRFSNYDANVPNTYQAYLFYKENSSNTKNNKPKLFAAKPTIIIGPLTYFEGADD